MEVDVAEPGLFPNPKGEQEALPLTTEPVVPAAAPIHPLDVPQVFGPATSYEVRDELEKLIARDLLGPWDGEHEEFAPRALGPRERYLVGMLGPRSGPQPGAADADVDADIAVQADATEAELPEVITPQSLGKLWASSMGMLFAVPSTVDAVAVTASWGSYGQHEIQDEDGKARRVWFRTPVSHEREIRLDGAPTQRISLTGTDSTAPGVNLAVDVRVRDGRRVVQLVLLNNQTEPERNADTAWLFQAQLRVTALDGDEAIFLPVDDPMDDVRSAGADVEEDHLRLLYRNQRRYAVGRNVAVHPDCRPGERRAWRLETRWLPTYNVPATVAAVGEGTALASVELSMDALAEADVATLRRGLAPLVDGYRAWLDEREAEIVTLPESLRPAAESAVFTARRVADRIEAGVALLTEPSTPRHDEALRAFRFANRAMALQRRHTEIGRERERNGLSYRDAEAKVVAQGAQAASWRPFQLAFVLLNLPSLTDPGHPERAADRSATVDLLFFPTGGGKTEAYLGLTAFTFAIRRLQGVVGAGADARSGSAGVAVLMRYTLRLLTAQQFQRAAALICAAEVLRRENEATWGGEPFRIGLWVGGSVSPNWYDEAAKQIAEAREAGHGAHTNVLQTLACPWCGSQLKAHRDLHPDDTLRRVLLFCPNGEGPDACPFSRTRSAEGLPILTVDEEIYRLTPSLVIATVDKLAQLPWQGFAGLVFGRVRTWCPRHGYRHDDLDERTGCGSRHNRKDNHPGVVSQPVVRLRPPDLIIQDELHLISGALGTTVGLFEAAVDELCTWRLPNGALTGPKIVASTATTKRAQSQVLGIFGRDLAVFPPPVTDIADTFFSQQVPVTPENPGRRYLGVCAHGVRLKAVEIRLAEILLISGQMLFDRHGASADPYMTVVGYFNTTRELAGMRRLLDDDVTNRVRSHGRAKGLSDRIVTASGMLTISELTSRISSADISEVLKRLDVEFDEDLDTSDRRRAAYDEFRRAAAARTNSNPKPATHPLAARFFERQNGDRSPVDVVLATSMLQVGVDVSRFGLMLIVGQPKNTAEYIQASSRVGRDSRRPGLVVTLYNWTRPRDLAHFEDFEYYHGTFYRQVEALSVTPYTRRALDRGAAGTFVAAVRNAEEQYSRNTDAHDVPLDAEPVDRITRRMLTRAEAIAGDRGRGYLRDRLASVTDAWNRAKSGSARIGYRDGTFNKQRLVGLLQKAGGGRWSVLTAGMSMRETENEINLLVPAGEELFQALYGAPAWAFGPPPPPDGTEHEIPDGDELGISTLDGGVS